MHAITRTLAKALALLDNRERIQVGFVVLLSLVAAVAESGGIVSITPILAVAADPGIIQSNDILRTLYSGLGFHTTKSFLVFLGAASLAALLVGIGFQALALWTN